MDKETILKIVEIISTSLAGLAAILVAVFSRRGLKTEEKRSDNELFTAQVAASKELVAISQSLIQTVEKEREGVIAKNKELEERLDTIQDISEENQRRIDSLTRDNSRILYVSHQLMNGIGILLVQLKNMKIEPAWTPPKELLDTLERRIESIKE